MSHLMTDSRMEVLTNEFSEAYANRKPNGEIWSLWTDSRGKHHMQHVESPGDDWAEYKKQYSSSSIVVDPVTTLCLQAGINSIDIPFVIDKSIAAQNMNKAVLLIKDKRNDLCSNSRIHSRIYS